MAYYILKDKTPIEVPITEWATWFESSDRIVKQDVINGFHVSTVFFGIDHSCGETGVPILFETMIFGGVHDGYQCRYSTYEEAETGHQKAIDMVSDILN